MTLPSVWPRTIGRLTRNYLMQSASIVSYIFNEMELHIKYCKEFGISREEMESAEENMGQWLAFSTVQRIHLLIEDNHSMHRLHKVCCSGLQLLLAVVFDTTCPDMFSTSGSPKTGSLFRSPWRHVCLDMQQLPSSCIPTQGLKGKAISTGPGSKTTLAKTTLQP